MSENGEIYTAGKNFTLPPALTAWTNSTSVGSDDLIDHNQPHSRGGICHCRHCRRQCKIFASGVNFSIFTHFLCFFPLKLLKLGEIDGVKFLAWKSGSVNFWTNSMSVVSTSNPYTLSIHVRDFSYHVTTTFWRHMDENDEFENVSLVLERTEI